MEHLILHGGAQVSTSLQDQSYCIKGGDAMEKKEPEYVNFKGVKIDNVSYNDIKYRVHNCVSNNGKGYICVSDVGNVIGAVNDKALFTAINASLLSIADGTPLAWFAKLVGCKSIERVAGADLMRKLFLENDGYKHYLLGDTELTIQRVIEKAKKMNGNIQITGHSPPFKEFDKHDNKCMIDSINKENPDIIWVSFGGGKQEKWMYQNIKGLNRGVMIGAGAAFRWVIGDLVTPPVIAQKMGLQWLFRMVEQFVKDPKEAWRFVKERGTIKRKLIFLSYFPRELKKARKEINVSKFNI